MRRLKVYAVSVVVLVFVAALGQFYAPILSQSVYENVIRPRQDSAAFNRMAACVREDPGVTLVGAKRYTSGTSDNSILLLVGFSLAARTKEEIANKDFSVYDRAMGHVVACALEYENWNFLTWTSVLPYVANNIDGDTLGVKANATLAGSRANWEWVMRRPSFTKAIEDRVGDGIFYWPDFLGVTYKRADLNLDLKLWLERRDALGG